MIRRLLVVILLAAPLYAQEKPDAPKPHFNRKEYLTDASLLGPAKTADAITTRQSLDRGNCEMNPIFGRHPSPAKQAGINLGFFAGQSVVLYLTEHSRHKWVRWTGRVFLAHTTEEHVRFAACNAGLDPRSPVVRNCRPFGF